MYKNTKLKHLVCKMENNYGDKTRKSYVDILRQI